MRTSFNHNHNPGDVLWYMGSGPQQFRIHYVQCNLGEEKRKVVVYYGNAVVNGIDRPDAFFSLDDGCLYKTKKQCEKDWAKRKADAQKFFAELRKKKLPTGLLAVPLTLEKE